MSEKQEDTAVVALLGVFGGAFATQWLSSLQQDGWSIMAITQLVAAILMIVAATRWSQIKSRLGSRYGETAQLVATDFRYWFWFALTVFLYLGTPRIIRPIGFEPELGDPSQGKYVCTHSVTPIGRGAGGLLVEFGMRQGHTSGIHVQIKLDRPWVDYQVGYGAPRRTSLPEYGGRFGMEDIEVMKTSPTSCVGLPPGCTRGPSATLVCTADPTVFQFTSPTPDISPRLSYYIYFAGYDTAPSQTGIAFFDDFYALDDLQKRKDSESVYGKCPY